MNNRYKNSMLLSAVGDALGWITEFEKNKEEIRKKYGKEEVDSFEEWQKFVGGRFNGYLDTMRVGDYSDDTQLMLSVARSMNSNGKVDNHYFSKVELVYWLNYARGAGRTVKNAARKVARKSATWNNNFFTYNIGKDKVDYRDSGANGAAMRVLPIALANRGDQEKIKKEIFSNSIITHGHPRALIGAILYGFAVNQMLKEELKDFSYIDYLTVLGKNIHEQFKINLSSDLELVFWVQNWNSGKSEDFESIYNQTIEEVLLALRQVFIAIKSNYSDNKALESFGCFAPSTKGSGVSTVIAGIYLACKYYNDPKEMIIKAVNSIGSDTDSIAAFAGGICGVLYEDDCIPNRWKGIQDEQYLIEMSEELLRMSNNEQVSLSKAICNTSLKSLDDIITDDFQNGDLVMFKPLGNGLIVNVDRQKTLTKGKYNVIIDVEFELGQSCKFSKLLKIEDNQVQF